MNVDSFLSLLIKKFDEILEKDLIFSSRLDEEYLGNSEWTYLFNVVLYQTIVDYNKKHKPQLIIAPEKGARMPKDFFLVNRSGAGQMYIEHENDASRIEKNYRKLLNANGSKYRLLVCYINKKNLTVEAVIKQLKNVKRKLSKKNGLTY